MVVGSALACAAIVFALPRSFSDPTAELNSPESAMSGMARVHAAEAYFLAFLLCAFLLVLVGIFHFVSVRHRVLTVVPCLFMLPLYASMRNGAAGVENVRHFRESFWASESALDALANQIETGIAPAFPVSAGGFVILGYEVLDGGVALFTKIGDTWRESRWGFVRLRNVDWDTGTAKATGFAGEVGQNNRVERLGGDWFVLFDTYTYIKRGWS